MEQSSKAKLTNMFTTEYIVTVVECEQGKEPYEHIYSFDSKKYATIKYDEQCKKYINEESKVQRRYTRTIIKNNSSIIKIQLWEIARVTS